MDTNSDQRLTAHARAYCLQSARSPMGTSGSLGTELAIVDLAGVRTMRGYLDSQEETFLLDESPA
jgi:hypothetical protein